jgi:hypothetical protein
MRSVVQLIRQDLARFGVAKTAYDVLWRSVNRLIVCKSLVLLKIDSVDPQLLLRAADFEARFLSRDETQALADDPEFDTSTRLLAEADRNGDACFGVFGDGMLLSACWYSTAPTKTSDGLTITSRAASVTSTMPSRGLGTEVAGSWRSA